MAIEEAHWTRAYWALPQGAPRQLYGLHVMSEDIFKEPNRPILVNLHLFRKIQNIFLQKTFRSRAPLDLNPPFLKPRIKLLDWVVSR